MGLRAKLLAVVLGDLPEPDSKLGEPSERWDELLGGRKGPNNWGRYGRASGTTCLIALNGWAIDAGFPSDMVVAYDTPNGGGTLIAQAEIAGAKARGWYHEPQRGELPDFRPGDVYQTNRDAFDKNGTKIDGFHTGVVVRVERSADGRSMRVETADGGQGTWNAQTAERQWRTFSLSDGPHPVLVQSRATSGWLQGWIAVGGDEADDVPQDGGGGEASGSLAAVVLGALGAAGVLGGLLYALVGRNQEPEWLRTLVRPTWATDARTWERAVKAVRLAEQRGQLGAADPRLVVQEAYKRMKAAPPR